MAQELKAYTHIDFRLHDLVNMQFYLTADVDAFLVKENTDFKDICA